MKALLFAVLAVTLSDLAINHGDGVHHVVIGVQGFFFWLAHIGDGSVFTQ